MKNRMGVAFCAIAVGVSGCQTMPQNNSQNLGVTNKPENSGAAQYGSEACRAAGIQVVPYDNYVVEGRSRTPTYQATAVWQRANPQYAVPVRSNRTHTYMLMPEVEGSNLASTIGAVGGVVAGVVVAKALGANTAGKVVGGVAGGVLGAKVAKELAKPMTISQREQVDRCRLDVMNGAYDSGYYGDVKTHAPAAVPAASGARGNYPAWGPGK